MAGVRKITYPRDQRGPINCHAYALSLTAPSTRAQRWRTSARPARAGFSAGSHRRPRRLGRDPLREGYFSQRTAPGQFRVLLPRPRRRCGLRSRIRLDLQRPSRLRARNGINLLAFHGADWGHSATQWQRSLYPAEMRSRISVLHEGVDTDLVRPSAKASFKLPGSGRVLTRRDEVVTYVARNLEPIAAFISSCARCPALAPAQARAGRHRG